ncbi:hypothetical protein SDC9_160833 [bioreactor metagenome]|uniref:Uncharacterized protein n=1 Tax=bioreactor metagenome TaxID=1076179 RepID=A0A645FJ04_9ZZZZ
MLRVSAYLDNRGYILAELRFVDIDMNHSAFFCVFLKISGSSVAEAHSHRDHQIRLRLRNAGGIFAVHTAHAEIKRIGIRNGGQTHHAQSYRSGKPF